MSDAEELRNREAEWTKCIETRDAAKVLDYLDEDYALVLVQPRKATMPRAVWLETLQDYVVHEWKTEEQTIDVSGDVGVVLQRVFMRATVNGADRSGIFVLTDIWRRKNGRWVVWRRHSTPLSAGAMPPARA